MTQDSFDQMISQKLKLIRTEAELTQDRLAEIIGISKKTLVQVEKRRKTLGFTASALAAVVFRNSEIIQSMFGDSVIELIDLVATNGKSKAWFKTMGGKVWWIEEKRNTSFILQKHVITGHYRIIDTDFYFHYYSLDKEEAYRRFEELTNA